MVTAGRINGKYQPLFKASTRTGKPSVTATAKAATPISDSRHLPVADVSCSASQRSAATNKLPSETPICQSDVPSVARTTAAEAAHIAEKKSSSPAAAQPRFRLNILPSY